MPKTEVTSYREVQYFRQKWLWCLLGGISVVLGGGFVRQIIYKVPFGNNPASDSTVIFIWLIFGVAFPGIFYFARLTTSVRSDGVHFRFFPFHFSDCLIKFTELRKYEIRTYSPTAEYGGWGIRYGRGGKAYNVSGNRGIQFELKNGEKILIGTQKAEEFLRALDESGASPYREV